MSWEDELAKAFSLITPIVVEPAEYRIHYDDDGRITMCSMQQHPENTQYIVVTKDEYDNYFRYTIVDSKLKKIDINTGCVVQLKKSDSGYKVVKHHCGLIIEADEVYENIEYYDTNN